MPDNESPKKVVVLEPREVIVLEETDDNGDDNGCDNNQKRGRRKRYSSRNSERLGDIEHRATDSLNRVADAIDHGVEDYTTKRDKSERERRDGALVDFLVNSAAGVSKTISESAYVLEDAAKAFTTNRRRKTIRKIVRNLPRF
jgi:hypothetical protein